MSLTSEDHRLGITPILIRRAAFYLELGCGTYYPEHPHYDKVVVQKMYDLMQNPSHKSEWGLGFVVNFYKNERCIRWIEFGCRVVGAGGDPIVRPA